MENKGKSKEPIEKSVKEINSRATSRRQKPKKCSTYISNERIYKPADPVCP